MSLHVEVSPDLGLPLVAQECQRILRLHDASLRLRRSVDHPEHYVLERKCLRSLPIVTTETIESDRKIQARDGYVHVSTVHPQLIAHPDQILMLLRVNGFDVADLSAQKIADLLDREEAAGRARRREQRRKDFEDRAAEGFDILDRVGNRHGFEKFRINNAGMPPPAHEADERSGRTHHEHEIEPESRPQDGQLHDPPAAGSGGHDVHE